MRRLLATAAIVAALPGSSPAQDRTTLLDMISLDRVVQSFVQTGIMALRTQLDLKYGDMAVDLRTGKITLTDVQAWPLPDWDSDGTCEVNIKRITLRSGAVDEVDRLRAKAQIIGASFPKSCLPPDAAGPLEMLSLETITIPRMTADIHYGVAASDAVVRIYAELTDVAAVDLTAKFAYVWVDGRNDMEEPDPVVFLDSATLTVENRGAWTALKGMLPPPFVDPAQAGLVIEGAIGGVLADMNRGSAPEDATGDPSALNDAQRAFLASVVETWPAFLNAPEVLVLQTDMASDTYLDFEAMEDDPREAFAALQPLMSLAPAQRAQMLPVSLLNDAMGDGASFLSDDDRLRAGTALMSGNGAPRNLKAGMGLLAPLAEAGNGAAAMAMAEALADSAPETAYRWALAAGKAGESGASARLDRLENALPFERVLALQEEVSGGDTHSLDALTSIAGIREQAAMRLSGQGQARSYAVASLWAVLATAAGDPEAADILADIDERVRLSGDGAQAAWAPYAQGASDLAMKAWISQDLPARYSR